MYVSLLSFMIFSISISFRGFAWLDQPARLQDNLLWFVPNPLTRNLISSEATAHHIHCSAQSRVAVIQAMSTRGQMCACVGPRAFLCCLCKQFSQLNPSHPGIPGPFYNSGAILQFRHPQPLCSTVLGAVSGLWGYEWALELRDPPARPLGGYLQCSVTLAQ